MSEILAWHPHLDTYGLILGLAVGYELGIRRLAELYAPRGEAVVTRAQRSYFYLGLALLLIVSSWPVHDIGERSLFTFHMTEHVVMALIAAPLILLGVPWWLMRVVVRPILPALRILTKPIIALVLFNTVLAGLHYEPILEAMLTSDLAHFSVHLALFLTALLMWWPVIGPVPDLPRLPPLGRMGYLFLQSLVPTVPAAFFTLATGPVYDIYDGFPKLFGWSTVADQTVAGLIMKLGGGLVLWTAIGIVFFTWFAEEQRHSRPVPVSK